MSSATDVPDSPKVILTEKAAHVALPVICDSAAAPMISKLLSAAISQAGGKPLFVDLRAVAFMDPVVVDALVAAHSEASAKLVALRLFGANGLVRTVFYASGKHGLLFGLVNRPAGQAQRIQG